MNKAQILYEYGAGSRESVRKASTEQKNAERQLEAKEKDYRHTLSDLSFDIGITYNPSIAVEPIAFEAANLEIPEDYSALIENSFKMKVAQSNLETAILARDDIYREYEEDDNVGDDVTIYDLKLADGKVTIAEENISSIREGLETAIQQLYYNVDQSYFNYEEAVRALENAQADINVLKIQYEADLISKHDYETALTQLKQLQINVNATKIQNYLAIQSIKALENGFVQ